MKRISKQLIYSAGLLFGVFLFFGTVLAQGGLETAADRAGLPDISVGKAIGNVIGAGLSLVAILFFLLMIYGGIKYMLSRGNEDSAKKAVNTIWGAMIGLFIILAAYALTNFVFTGLGSSSGSVPAQAPTPTGTVKYLCDPVYTSEPLCKGKYDGDPCGTGGKTCRKGKDAVELSGGNYVCICTDTDI